jgi:hypothetical protein
MAARYRKLPLLQWSRANSCPWREPAMLGNASVGGSVLLLEWLLTVTAPWPAYFKTGMLDRAGWNNHLAAAKWLEAQGAEWPLKFIGQAASRRVTTAKQRCWTLPAVQWAIASGSGWLDWRCQDYAAGSYVCEKSRQNAADLLKWAHANGCPCTCEHHHHQQQ